MRPREHLMLHVAKLFFLTAVLAASAAQAESAFSVAVLGGYAQNQANGVAGTSDQVNAYGVALGGRAGYTWGSHVYVGVSYRHHFGFSGQVQGAAYETYLNRPHTGTPFAVSSHIDPVLLEGGYELRFAAFTVRPYLGAGVSRYGSSVTVEDAAQTPWSSGQGQRLTLAPGVLATYDVTSHLFAGLDLHYNLVITGLDSMGITPLGGSASAFGADATVGLRF